MNLRSRLKPAGAARPPRTRRKMPLLPQEWVQELLTRIHIRDVIEKYIPLEQKGSRYVACCPFHHEKTPSFSVTPEKGLFYCFGCHKGGNAIQFVSEIERISFREACEKLAEECGLELPSASFSTERQAARKRIETIRKINRAAALFFVEQLEAPRGAAALAYLRGRGLRTSDVRRNGIGFAPADDWHTMMRALSSQGYSEAQMRAAGLLGSGASGAHDLFHNRVMFPIIDGGRNVIGFGGRVMDDHKPKYLNTPATPVFSKRHNLYHLNVLQQLTAVPRILLMEGYMDVIAADRFGVRNTVATLGTALTPEQARLLKRWGVPVYISYDGDHAGLTAALKAIGVLEAAGVTARVVTLPDGMDPDEFLRVRGSDAFEDAVNSALEPVPFRFSQVSAGLDLSAQEDRERYVEGCIAVLRGQSSAVARERYARLLADQTGYSLHAILRDTEGPYVSEHAVPLRQRSAPARRNSEQEAEDFLAAYVVEFPDRSSALGEQLTASDFDDAADAAIVTAVAQSVAQGITPRADDILAALEEDAHRNHAAALLGSDKVHAVSDLGPEPYASGCVTRLQVRRAERRLNEARDEQRTCADPARKTALKREILELTETVHSLRQTLKRPAATQADS